MNTAAIGGSGLTSVGNKSLSSSSGADSKASSNRSPGVTSNGGNNSRPEGNPFEEEEWDEYPNDALVDNGEPGVPVKALYDYEGAEMDELSFKKGSLYFLLLLLFSFASRLDLFFFIVIHFLRRSL